MRRFALALFPLILAAVPLDAKSLPARLPPIDQCKGDRSFEQFRTTLKRAVAKKDRGAFLRLLAPDVTVDFGGGTGPAAFQKQWDFDEPDDPEGIWALLKIILTMGCVRDGATRTMPSLDQQMALYNEDLSQDLALILPGAKLYKETGIESAKPYIAPWTLAAVTSRAGDLVTGVKLPDGRNGFVSDTELYEPLGYRLVVEKRRGKWVITAFVAGD